MLASKVFSHTQYVLINRLAVPIGGFVLLIIIARHSDLLLGRYALVTTFYYVMQMLPLLGLTSFVMREVARAPHHAGRYFVTIGALSIVGALAVVAGSLVFLRYVDYDPQVTAAINVLAIVIFPGILAFIAELIFMSLHQAKPVAQVAVLENIARVLLSALMLTFDGGVVSLMWVLCVTRTGALFAYLWYFRRTGAVPKLGLPDAGVLRDTLHVLPTFMLGAVVLITISRMDFLVLSVLEQVEVLGYYAIAYRLFEVSVIGLTALLMAMFPWVSRKFTGARRNYLVAIKSVTMLFAGVLMTVCSAGVLLCEYYVIVLFPDQYPYPVPLTQLFLAALFVAGLDFVASGILHASDQQGPDVRATTYGGIAFTALLLWWVPILGIYGALAARLAATLVQAGMKYAAIQRTIGRLWGVRELLSMSVPLVVSATIALSALDANIFIRLLACLALIVMVPVAMAVSGHCQPLRLLRFYRRPRIVADVGNLTDLLDVFAADARQRDRMLRARRASGLRERPRRQWAIVICRLARYLYLRGHRHTARMLSGFNRLFLGFSAPAEIQIPSGLCVLHNGPFTVSNEVSDHDIP